MIVFSNYFKIVKRYKMMIIIYTVIFLFFAVIGTTSNQSNVTNFSSTKPHIAFINNDSDTTLLSSFKKYVEGNAVIADIKSDDASLRDALFFRTVDYIMIIPSNFTNDFMNNKNTLIKTMKVPNSYQSTYTEMLLNKYLNIAKLYARSGMSEKEIGEKTVTDLKQSGIVKMETKNKDINVLDNARYYYNFTNYTLLGLTILIIGMTMSSFRDQKIKRRNMVSPVPLKRINGELTLGNLSITLIIWVIYVLISFALYYKIMVTMNGLLLIINSLVFSICALSLGFLIGNITNNRQANSSIANVVSLGSSFLCGAFVPQSMLGESVLRFAHIIPSYWFIRNNDIIATINTFSFDNLKPIIINMAAVLLFALLFYILMQSITRWKLKHS